MVRFNPCFNRSGSATCFRKRRDVSRGKVSILVLIDRVLQHGARVLEGRRCVSFNPCFNRSGSATMEREMSKALGG